MRRVLLLKLVPAVAAALTVTAGLTGCVDRTPPPANARIPHERTARNSTQDVAKPMPGENVPDDSSSASLPPPPFNDEPLVSQETPEQRAFVDAYNQVGRPRMVVFVNRTLDGELIPANSASAAGDNSHDVFADKSRAALPKYDEAVAKQIDYEAIEIVLTDWLSCGGKTAIVSPITARQRLTDEQVKALQNGRPMTGDIAKQLDADILIHVTAQPTRETERGLEVRLVAEAVNLGRDGQSIGRGFVDMAPPLDKPRINKFTRFLARVLMDRMIGSWENMPAPGPGADNRTPGRREDVPPAPQRSTSAPAPTTLPPPAPDDAPPAPTTTTKDQ